MADQCYLRRRRTGCGMSLFRVASTFIVSVVITGVCAAQSAAGLVDQFNTTHVFWQQFDVARKIVELHDASVLTRLEGWLTNDDRHLRGNAAFVFASLGDPRGLDVITAMLSDASERHQGQGIGGGLWSLAGQIGADRYYAVHLLGELRDARAIPVLAGLLDDKRVNYKVAWALGEIGGSAAIRLLLQMVRDNNPDVRVTAINALGKLGATEALPILKTLLDDNERSHFDKLITVAEAARGAIAKLEAKSGG